MKHPKESEGARTERQAVRSYLRRQIKRLQTEASPLGAVSALTDALNWVLAREKRYDKRAGGL